MVTPDTSTPPETTLAERAVSTARRWLDESASAPVDPAARRLAGVLSDPGGLDFTLGFVDRVVRPEDLRVAGRDFERLSRSVPDFLPWYLRAAVIMGGGFAPLLPNPIVPVARKALRRMVGHLVIDAEPAKLDATLARLRTDGRRLNLNLLGEAVLGDAEADRRLAGTRALLERDDVDYVSIKVSSVASQLSMWAFDETVDRVVERIAPLYEYAAERTRAGHPKFINLDMEEFKDLDLTVEVFTRLLGRPDLLDLEAGIVLQAYLPDSLEALDRLTEWATERRRAGGTGVKVRIVKGANLAMERVDARIHGWPLATWSSKLETDTHYKRLLHRALEPERAAAVRVGVAGHNLFDLAYAWHLAHDTGTSDRVEAEMLLGMATAQADAVARDFGGLLLYTPVVHDSEFDTAISYLVRRLEENASDENFMSSVFELATDDAAFARERERFEASLAALDDEVPLTHRVQERDVTRESGFDNEADTDPAQPANREWARRLLERAPSSTTGVATVQQARVGDAARLDRLVAAASDASAAWSARPVTERSRILHDAGAVLSAFRGRLVETMVSETGKVVAEADPEVSEAIDFAHFYAESALELEHVDNATYVAPRVTVVAPPWNFPVAIPAGGVMAALAAGSAVVFKPAPQARRCAAVVAEALWEAGVPREVLVFADVAEGELGQRLIEHQSVDRVILTGAFETAALFRSWRPELALSAETSGKNAIVVTPSADLDLAVADVVRSAFGHAGQKCSAASLVILVGAAGESERFRRQLVDAVRSLKVGWATEATTQMGPLTEPASGKLLEALTTFGPGESWLVQPERLDDEGRLWTPGVRDGVREGSEFHLTEYFGPVLGIMTAESLDQAIGMQNDVAYGLTAGIHSLDVGEVAQWIDEVEAGNLYVNRGITGAIVRRQPFGGWKRSSVGPGAKAGGPNYVLSLGRWDPIQHEVRNSLQLTGVGDAARALVQAGQKAIDFAEFDRVREAAQSDEAAWQTEFGRSRDISDLRVERNVFRYRPTVVAVRLSEGAPMVDLVRLLAAAARAGSAVELSSAVPVPTGLASVLESGVTMPAGSVTVETDAAWRARAASGELAVDRIRLIGGDSRALLEALGPDSAVSVFSAPVTTSGRIELQAFLREQAVSITAHRFGNPDRAFIELPV